MPGSAALNLRLQVQRIRFESSAMTIPIRRVTNIVWSKLGMAEAPDNHDIVQPEEFIIRDVIQNSKLMPVPQGNDDSFDERLYLPKHNGWDAVIKQNWEQEYCYAKFPGEDWFHFLANGELYVARGNEKYCLSCAIRLKILTRNRLFWQKGVSESPDRYRSTSEE